MMGKKGEELSELRGVRAGQVGGQWLERTEGSCGVELMGVLPASCDFCH